jgi:hypothetical protein
MDLFAGSGTTLVAAERHGRRWIGCDAGALAIHTAKKRLLEEGASAFAIARGGDETRGVGANSAVHVSIRDNLGGGRIVKLDRVEFKVMPPEEIRVRGKLRPGSWVDLVDYWSVGSQQSSSPFMSERHAFRMKPQAELTLQLELHAIRPGRLCVRVVDWCGVESQLVL